MKKLVLIILLVLLTFAFYGCDNSSDGCNCDNGKTYVHIYESKKCYKVKDYRSWGHGCYQFVLEDGTKLTTHLHQCAIIIGECPFCKEELKDE